MSQIINNCKTHTQLHLTTAKKVSREKTGQTFNGVACGCGVANVNTAHILPKPGRICEKRRVKTETFNMNEMESMFFFSFFEYRKSKTPGEMTTPNPVSRFSPTHYKRSIHGYIPNFIHKIGRILKDLQ